MISPLSPHENGWFFHGSTKASFAAPRQEMWYEVVHKPAVMIREEPDEKALLKRGIYLISSWYQQLGE